MKETFSHKLFSSFLLWFDYQLLKNGEAYVNQTGIFYPTVDESLPDYSIYTCPYKQLVYDSSIAGANIISGVHPVGSSSFKNRGTSGLSIDFQNGRVLLNSGVNLPSGFSGSFAKKEFNTYITNFDSSQFIFESVMGNNPNIEITPTGIPSRVYAAPCAILNLANSLNNGFAFGGEDKTTSTIRAVIISQNLWQQDGVLSLFRDTNNLPFPIIPSNEIPINYLGDLKTGYYNYENLVSTYQAPGQMPWIEKVYSSKTSEDANKNGNYYVSFLEFDINAVRIPRAR